MNGSFESCKLLVEGKANLKTVNKLGKTAVEEAYDKGFYEVSEYLLEMEATYSEKSNEIIVESQEDEEFEDNKNI